ncbi:MAG: late competence development ComFB family protein [bacterium]|nr:late competence development ComFB family protein [bacterium]
MSKKEKYEVNGHSLEQVRNICEILVVGSIRKLMPEYPAFDQCSMCIEDVYALSLSRLPATYAHAGSIILNREVSAQDVDDVVRYAILQVSEHPKHG